MNTKTVKTFNANIYIAGDISRIRDICGEYCESGFCVSITSTEFVYTYGRETGAIIGIINYPRFPKQQKEIKKLSILLSEKLITGLHQGSCTIVFTDETVFISRRPEDEGYLRESNYIKNVINGLSDEALHALDRAVKENK